MSKFVNEIKEICKKNKNAAEEEEKNKKVDMYIDMDGTIAEYHLYNPEEISRKMEEEYLKNEPLKNVIDVLEEISKINNIEMYILSLSKTKKITEKKKIWLKKYVPFIKEENWIILTKEIGEYSNENRNEIKGKNIELRQKDYDKSIMLDDEQVVLREAKKILNDKIEVFHISSALI